ncbi:putative extracellular serine-rich protein [Venturia nashicola]|nr:putative extracellular serine-rich protein [Venturia nashicola]
MPVWYYCNAIDSCTPNGMVGVINPLESQSITKQIASAKKAAYQIAPGEPLPVEGASPTSSSTATPSSTSDASHPAHKSSLGGGAIAGIVVGAIAILAIAAALFYFMGRSKTYKDMFASSRHGGGVASEHPQSEMGRNDRVGPWIPNPSSIPPYTDNPSVSGHGSQSRGGSYQDHRISQMTYNSMAPSTAEGTFVGYNRNTGEPEFAAEAPAGDVVGHGHGGYSAKTSPAVKQGGWASPGLQPGAVPIVEEQTQVFEAPGDTPGDTPGKTGKAK